MTSFEHDDVTPPKPVPEPERADGRAPADAVGDRADDTPTTGPADGTATRPASRERASRGTERASTGGATVDDGHPEEETRPSDEAHSSDETNASDEARSSDGTPRPDDARPCDDTPLPDGTRRPDDIRRSEANRPGPEEIDGSDELNTEEAALRALFQSAVQGLEPADGTLDRLRHAVPARKARKRQLILGAAAAALVIGAAVPALVHVSHTTGSATDRTSVAGHGEATHRGADGDKAPGGGDQDSAPPAGGDPSHDKSGKPDRGADHGSGSGGNTAGGPDTSNGLAAKAPVCSPGELGSPVASLTPPDAEGKVYGSFVVTNVSTANCTVDGPGSIAALPQGAADPTRINVVDHTAGDAATGLPDPSQESATLVLEPGRSYAVKFAWVPSASCASGGEADPSPDPTGTDGAPTDGGVGGPDQGMGTQLYREDDTPAEGSVTVSHTAEPGAPAAQATIPNACAGTLYRTSVLPAP